MDSLKDVCLFMLKICLITFSTYDYLYYQIVSANGSFHYIKNHSTSYNDLVHTLALVCGHVVTLTAATKPSVRTMTIEFFPFPQSSSMIGELANFFFPIRNSFRLRAKKSGRASKH